MKLLSYSKAMSKSTLFNKLFPEIYDTRITQNIVVYKMKLKKYGICQCLSKSVLFRQNTALFYIIQHKKYIILFYSSLFFSIKISLSAGYCQKNICFLMAIHPEEGYFCLPLYFSLYSQFCQFTKSRSAPAPSEKSLLRHSPPKAVPALQCRGLA